MRRASLPHTRTSTYRLLDAAVRPKASWLSEPRSLILQLSFLFNVNLGIKLSLMHQGLLHEFLLLLHSKRHHVVLVASWTPQPLRRIRIGLGL